jgi:hydroxyacid-oxoacid transhydrogenase
MSGNGSKTTGEVIFDNSSMQSKTGVAHQFLEMALGIIDPDNLVDMPSGVAKYSGLDVLCHSIES